MTTTDEYHDENRRSETIDQYTKQVLNAVWKAYDDETKTIRTPIETILEEMYDYVYHQGYSQGVINEMRGEDKG